MRFSRQSITELLVAAEQTANFFPYISELKQKIRMRKEGNYTLLDHGTTSTQI